MTASVAALTASVLAGSLGPAPSELSVTSAFWLHHTTRLRETASGLPVSRDMTEVVDAADAVVATGMTLSNGSFDVLLDRCREQEKPLAFYAQTGGAVIRSFLGSGVAALSAEPLSFSQFSSRPTSLYRYRSSTATRA